MEEEEACPECPPPGAPGWMVTYGDLMTLLLCFFVLLFSFSSMDKKKFETLKESMTGAFGAMSGNSTSMGTGISRKTPRLLDKTFDKAVSDSVTEIKEKVVPKERIELLTRLMLESALAMKLISDEKQQVEKIVQHLERPQSVADRRMDNLSHVEHQTVSNESPKNQSEDAIEYAASAHNKKENESAKQELDPQFAKGETYDPRRSDNTQQDISSGRDQILLENTGRQKSRDRLSGKNRPEDEQQDREPRRSDERNYDFKRPSNKIQTLEEYKTLAGMVRLAPHDASHTVFHLESDLLFSEGSVELKELAKEMVYQLFRQRYDRDEGVVFQIEAHTDLSFQPSERFPSAWHFAAARAQAVIDFLLEEDSSFDPGHFALVSFGAWQPKYRYPPGVVRVPQNSRLEIRAFREP